MRVYLCGAMSLDKGYYQRFLNAEIAMKKLGYEVINPAKVYKALPKDMVKERNYHRIGMALIETCDAICLLKGWETNYCCQKEKEYAQQLELKLICEKKKQEATHE